MLSTLTMWSVGWGDCCLVLREYIGLPRLVRTAVRLWLSFSPFSLFLFRVFVTLVLWFLSLQFYRSTSIVLKRIHALHLQSDFIFRLSDLHRKNQEYIKPMHKFAINVSSQWKVISLSDVISDDLRYMEIVTWQHYFLYVLYM